jgi:hypothetical protein
LLTKHLGYTAFAAAIVCALLVAAPQRAQAIPIFAQRYHLQCETCHTVIPELNAFGNAFRNHGYRLPLPRHGTTVAALRYQLEWEANPNAGNRRFSPGGVILGNEDFGRVAAFIHYSLGAGGGPGGLYLGYLATYNQHSNTLYRAGLFELPLAQSPGQRLDDLAPYGYYGAHVGLNDLALSAPRWGAEVEQGVGAARIGATIDLGEFKGAPYGGKPVPTGETTSAATPELGLYLRSPVTSFFDVGATAMTGTRNIVRTGTSGFKDGYRRLGLMAHAHYKRADFQAEQWYGRDANADGFDTVVGSSGGYARFKYYVTQHSYFGVRYDAFATPIVTRDVVYYYAFMVTPHVRMLFQQLHTVGGQNQFGAALTVGFPWPANL